MIGRVLEGSPAERAGIEVGDILTSVDGETVGSAAELAGTIGRRE